jgi:hypothetical protein
MLLCVAWKIDDRENATVCCLENRLYNKLQCVAWKIDFIINWTEKTLQCVAWKKGLYNKLDRENATVCRLENRRQRKRYRVSPGKKDYERKQTTLHTEIYKNIYKQK